MIPLQCHRATTTFDSFPRTERNEMKKVYPHSSRFFCLPCERCEFVIIGFELMFRFLMKISSHLFALTNIIISFHTWAIDFPFCENYDLYFLDNFSSYTELSWVMLNYTEKLQDEVNVCSIKLHSVTSIIVVMLTFPNYLGYWAYV